MSDYSEERHNILKKMANISQEIEYNRSRIKSDKNAIKEWEIDMVVKQKEIDDHIYNVLNNAIEKLNLKPERLWGEMVEDRMTQITISTLGQEAPIEEEQKQV